MKVRSLITTFGVKGQQAYVFRNEITGRYYVETSQLIGLITPKDGLKVSLISAAAETLRRLSSYEAK